MIRNLLDAIQGILGHKFFPHHGVSKIVKSSSNTFRDEIGKNNASFQKRLSILKDLLRSHEPDACSSFLLNHEEALRMLVDPNSPAREKGNRVAHGVLEREFYERAIGEETDEKQKAVYETFLNILIPVSAS